MRTRHQHLGQPPFYLLPWAKEEKLVKAPRAARACGAGRTDGELMMCSVDRERERYGVCEDGRRARSKRRWPEPYGALGEMAEDSIEERDIPAHTQQQRTR